MGIKHDWIKATPCFHDGLSFMPPALSVIAPRSRTACDIRAKGLALNAPVARKRLAAWVGRNTPMSSSTNEAC